MSGTGFLVTDTSSAGPSATDDDTSTAVTEPTTPSPLPTTTFGKTGHIVSYTAPVTGLYDIEAIGASGSPGSGSNKGGLGADVSGEVKLAAGEVLSIAVGGTGGAPAGKSSPERRGQGAVAASWSRPAMSRSLSLAAAGAPTRSTVTAVTAKPSRAAAAAAAAARGVGAAGADCKGTVRLAVNLRTQARREACPSSTVPKAGHIPPTTLT